jgi:osmotically-inducible protein OsmY
MAQEDTIKREVIDQISWDDSVNANDIHVDVIEDTVKLMGTVPNHAAKMAAERDAYYVTGVTNVDNDLEIKYPKEEFTDEDIADNVGNLLLWNGNITSNDISVDVNRGVVTLRGDVDSYWEKRLAKEISMSASGAVDVVNDLQVKLRRSYADEDIKDDIYKAFQRNPIIDENKIEIDVDKGIVKLSGTVANYQIKHQAHRAAQYTAGVQEVIDKIIIL